MNEVFELLELDRLLLICSEEASSELGKRRVLESVPSRNPAEIRRELILVREMARLLETAALPIHGISDVSDTLARIAPEGGSPDRDDYLPLNDSLSASTRLKAFISASEEECPGLKDLSALLHDFTNLSHSIERVFDPSGEIRDNASAELKRLRKQIQSEIRKQHDAMERVLKHWHKQNYTQEDALTFREGRLLIPVKSEHRGRIDGVVLDESATGATVFVEPLEAITIGNAIRKLQSEERREINRILMELCDSIRAQLPEIRSALEILSQIDHIYARARFSRRLNCMSPRISNDPVIKLVEARHPLLVLKEGADVVPLTLTLGEAEGNILIITGPNAGGKTVALKTVGLLCLMAACGLHIPAGEGSELPVLGSIHCDIGDPQSLEQDLSTFTSHLHRLKDALEDGGEPKLVLLDEVGSGTDPAEGSAIARAALLEFRRQGALVIATTHQGTLKVFAHETGGIFNGSMEFDSDTLSPTFRFRSGLPGSSYALEISARVGLDDHLLEDAKEFLGEQTTRMEELLTRLNDSLRQSEEARRAAELKRTESEALQKLYAERLENLKKTEKEKLREAAREAKEILKGANKRIEAVVKEIKEKQAGKEVIKSAHQSVKNAQKKIGKILDKGRKPETEAVERWTGKAGDWVRMEGLKDAVPVTAVRKDGREAKLEVGGVHIWMDTSKLKAVKAPKKIDIGREVKVSVSSSAGQQYELDLRGMMADEAEFTLEKYLSDCAISNWKNIRIIHGKGTGALRTRVQEVLKSYPGVKSFRYGRPEEGEFGVTVVEME